ncbi:GspE/PulE family protein [Vibrio scophthalmi]|uniref:Exonuclease sbcC n=1 Tax=Vibrio scophthalmi LMG 19158 TaxID=870967 RepID=F9RIG4_9VIBR|nr:ATPase, T2SS/T4P/T4SS family [Vibrio scophthalmi]EGU42496.1 exonuclease sbcC [Vibrio scophthalmi LMG 19158]
MNHSNVVVSDQLKSLYFTHQNAVLLEDGTLLTSDYDSAAIELIKNHIIERNDEYPELLGAVIKVEKTDTSTIAEKIESLSTKGVQFQMQNGDISTIGQDAKNILQLAVKRGVSDVHIELYGNETRIMARIDGRMVELQKTIPEYNYGLTLLSYLFNQLGKDQDADFSPKAPNNCRIEIDLITPDKNNEGKHIEVERETRWRVSYIPAQNNGGQVTLRWLNKNTTIPRLEDLGWEEGHIEAIRRFLNSPFGLLLLAGQVGSGKSTGIAGMLSEMKGSGRSMNTLEDPVEFDIGVMQTSVRSTDELNNFIKLLLRHDVDIEMHGELRTQEGAMAACRKAETGQLVFSTIHTSSAVGIAHTLNEQMKIPLALIAAPELMKVWVYQTLVRTLCTKCSLTMEEASPLWSERESAQFKAWSEHNPVSPLMRFRNPNGCACCNQGENGRTSLVEMIFLDDIDRQFILNKDYLNWGKALKSKNYKTVLDHANLKIGRGEIDIFTAAKQVDGLFERSSDSIYDSFFTAIDAPVDNIGESEEVAPC